MKKRITLLICLLLVAVLLPLTLHTVSADDRYLYINEITFPDKVFRDWIIENLPVTSDSSGYYMTWEQADAVKSMSIVPWFEMIESLSGIEYFTGLEYLSLPESLIEELDVSHNLALRYLECSWCRLSSLDVSKNTALESLYIDGSHITEIDVSHNSALRFLSIRDCKVSELDVRNNHVLETLDCSYADLTTLDVSTNHELKHLMCEGNNLTTINVSENPKLETLSCGHNLLTAVDVTHNTELCNLNIGFDPDPEGFVSYADYDIEDYDQTNCISAIDLSMNKKLEYFAACGVQLTSLDVSNNTSLKSLAVMGNQLRTIDISGLKFLEELCCGHNPLNVLDISQNAALQTLECNNAQLIALDVTKCADLEYLDCGNNSIVSIDLTHNASLYGLHCSNNLLTHIDLSNNDELAEILCNGNQISYLDLSGKESLYWIEYENQDIPEQIGSIENGKYTYHLSAIIPAKYLSNVRLANNGFTYNASTGTVSFPSAVNSFKYYYDTTIGEMDVTVYLTFEGLPAFDGTVEWNSADVRFNGKTPYVVANGKAQTPRFTVFDKAGNIVNPANYVYAYRENVNAGTAYVVITFTSQYSGTAQAWFKIYLPATDYTMVENRDDGIYMEWHAVEGAAGYVIYRRAWSSTTGGKWTDFVRWNNTTELNWTDKTVYAGTRYQYGIKAYFERRVDPVSGATIGGNVGDNYNLGIVGPLKTTVRITTRKLNSVTGGSKQLTVKWAGSSLFTGYEVQIATDAAFTKNVKTVKITNPKTYQTTIKSLKAKTTYYVRVRSYHLFEGMTYFGGWSNVLSGKTK